MYVGRWEKGAVSYLKQNGPDLQSRPTWLFQSGPAGPSRDQSSSDHPGSDVPDVQTPGAVRRQCQRLGLASPTTFGGNLDPARARGLVARLMAKGPLAGDFRDWDQIRAWTDDVADQLAARRAPAGT